MSVHLDDLLDLPNVRVESYTQIEGSVTLKIVMCSESMVCPHCGSSIDELHQNRPILVRDLSIFGRPTYLHLPRRQFYCSECQRYSTERLDFVDQKRRHTQRYEEDIYQRVQSYNMEQIGREEGLKYDEIKGVFDHIRSKKTEK
ncbi:MAG: transposase family protein [Merismopedia sp. SIO2A8]|nr:transposase family protein [Merismopedia sp. SIO2A8]